MAEPARKFEPAPEKVELLPPDFKLPDLSPLPPDEYERETKISFDTNINGLDLTMNISFIRLEDAAQPYIMNLEIKGYLPGTKERVTSFKGVINNAARLSWSDQPQKTNNSNYYSPYTRHVEKEYRKKGLGEYNLRLVEEVLEKIKIQYPEIAPDWIEIRTTLGSLSNLLIDPDWLENYLKTNNTNQLPRLQKLWQRSQNKNRNLGYIPSPQEIDNAIQLLQRESEELEDVKKYNESYNEVRYIKSLNPDFDPEEEFKE